MCTLKKAKKYDHNLGEIRQNQEGDKIAEGSSFQQKNSRLYAWDLSSKNDSGKQPQSRQNSMVKRQRAFKKLFPFSSSEKAFFICLVDYEILLNFPNGLTTYRVRNQQRRSPDMNFWNSYDLKVHLSAASYSKGSVKNNLWKPMVLTMDLPKSKHPVLSSRFYLFHLLTLKRCMLGRCWVVGSHGANVYLSIGTFECLDLLTWPHAPSVPGQILVFIADPPKSCCVVEKHRPGTSLVVQNPPCNAGNWGLIPGRGTKIPPAAERLNPPAPTTEPKHCSQSLCTAARRPHVTRWRPHVPQRRLDTARERKCISIAGAVSSIPGRRTKISQAMWYTRKIGGKKKHLIIPFPIKWLV